MHLCRTKDCSGLGNRLTNRTTACRHFGLQISHEPEDVLTELTSATHPTAGVVSSDYVEQQMGCFHLRSHEHSTDKRVDKSHYALMIIELWESSSNHIRRRWSHLIDHVNDLVSDPRNHPDSRG